jgi:NADP-dependent aldehyde dehydrogenase
MSQPIYVQGQWKPARGSQAFTARNPQTRTEVAVEYPVSTWEDCDEMLTAAQLAAHVLEQTSGDKIASFLEDFAKRIEDRARELVEVAHQETGLPKSPRLADVELPRTTGQMRQAAAAAREGSWRMACIDSQAGIRSYMAPIGPVCVFGPNNFPFAFNSISGGDFVAAIAAGNPVIAKANSSHPGTTRVFAEAAAEAEHATQMPPGTVQLLYRLNHADGERLVSDPRVGATGYTGSRTAGLKLKAAADAAGNPIYLELSSINPVVFLPGALRERGAALADEFSSSCLMGSGQFCTNPGLVILLDSSDASAMIERVAAKFSSSPGGTLLSEGVESSLRRAIDTLASHGARVIAGGSDTDSGNAGYSVANTLLTVTGAEFLRESQGFQEEAFGNATLFVIARDVSQVVEILNALEGNLTGSIYSDTEGLDDDAYATVAPAMRRKVGRLLNDKMPTGVAVSAAMNHGGPYPATGHPGFTAVGIPAALRRFAMLQSFDNVRETRLPSVLRDTAPNSAIWRMIDGRWVQG